jgi:hypothetical protein
MPWSGHQLLSLNGGELGEGAIRCLISPDPLTGRKHRITAITFRVVAIILVAMYHHLIANPPTFDAGANGPNHAGGI